MASAAGGFSPLSPLISDRALSFAPADSTRIAARSRACGDRHNAKGSPQKNEEEKEMHKKEALSPKRATSKEGAKREDGQVAWPRLLRRFYNYSRARCKLTRERASARSMSGGDWAPAKTGPMSEGHSRRLWRLNALVAAALDREPFAANVFILPRRTPIYHQD